MNNIALSIADRKHSTPTPETRPSSTSSNSFREIKISTPIHSANKNIRTQPKQDQQVPTTSSTTKNVIIDCGTVPRPCGNGGKPPGAPSLCGPLHQGGRPPKPNSLRLLHKLLPQNPSQHFSRMILRQRLQNPNPPRSLVGRKALPAPFQQIVFACKRAGMQLNRRCRRLAFFLMRQ